MGVGGWGDGKGVERTGEQPAALLKSVVFYRVFFWVLVAFPIELYRILRVRQFSRVFFFGVTGFYRVSLVHGISRALPIVPLPSVTEFLLHVKLKCHLPL